jgi:ABC-type polysaccharide/polyol phosphate export permease
MIDRATYLGNGFIQFFKEVFRNRRLILELTRREMRSRYLGSAFGIMWSFIFPVILTLLYWIVFQFGLKSGRVNGVPFIVWLLPGMVPWFYASDCIAGGSTIILENRFLVKKVVFRVSLLPVVRLLSLLPAHLFFIFTMTVIFCVLGYYPRLEWIQLVYYLFAMMMFSIGLSWLLSALAPFLRDLVPLVQVIIQILFWVTPIVWPADSVPAKQRWMLDINPLNYIVRGYREAMVSHLWFWQNPWSGVYFWIVTFTLLTVGGVVFLRLRPHFADVL